MTTPGIEQLIRETLAEDAEAYEPGAADLWDGVVERTTRPVPLFRRPQVLAAAAAAVVVLVAAVGLLLGDGGGSRVDTRTPPAESPDDGVPDSVPGPLDPTPSTSTPAAPAPAGEGAGPGAGRPRSTPTTSAAGSGAAAPPAGRPGRVVRDPGPSNPRRFLTTRGDSSELVLYEAGAERVLAGGPNDRTRYAEIDLTADAAVYLHDHVNTYYDTDLVLAPLDGSPAVVIPRVNGAVLSGDDRVLAYMANDGSAMSEIVVWNRETGAEKRFPMRDNPWGMTGSSMPHLAALAGDSLVMEAPTGPNRRTQIWSLDTARHTSLREARRLSEDGPVNVVPFDATTVVAGLYDNTTDLVYLDAATGAVKRRQTVSGGIPGALRGDGRGGVYCVRELRAGTSEMRALSAAGTFDVVVVGPYDASAAW